MRAPAQRGGIQDLIQRTSVLEIVGNMIRVRANEAALGDLAEVLNVDGAILTARVVGLDRDVASLQVFAGGKGLSTQTLEGTTRLHRPQRPFPSANARQLSREYHACQSRGDLIVSLPDTDDFQLAICWLRG
jgi:hypothetical protein